MAGAAYVPNDSGVASAAGPPARLGDGPVGAQRAVRHQRAAAWSQVSKLGGSGGKGVTIAILDSGVAYSTRGSFTRSPDLSPSRFTRGYDFIGHDAYPNDEFGHGTLVASIVGATANNAYGTVGVAYRAKIMPVRVLDFEGKSDAATIAEGLRWAVEHGADVINLSLELFDAPPLRPTPRSVMTQEPCARRWPRRARRASSSCRPPATASTCACPARRTTRSRSTSAARPSTAASATTPTTVRGWTSSPPAAATTLAPRRSQLQPGLPPGRDISGVSFEARAPRRFEILPSFRGTSAAAPHVTGVVALVLASGILGAHPTPGEVERHLERTARDLGAPGPDRYYGHGLLDATAAPDAKPRATSVSPSG